MIKEMDITWLRPKRWWKRPSFRINKAFTIAGQEIPVGFVTDFTSIPWFARWLFLIMGQWAPAAALHDFLIDKPGVTEKEAAEKFKTALYIQKCPYWISSGMYYVITAADYIRLQWSTYVRS